MLETPVTSSPLVAGFLSNLPAYRTGVSPLLRGIEVGLAHGLLLTGAYPKSDHVAADAVHTASAKCIFRLLPTNTGSCKVE